MDQEVENSVVRGTASGIRQYIGIFILHSLIGGRNLLQQKFSLT